MVDTTIFRSPGDQARVLSGSGARVSPGASATPSASTPTFTHPV
jgi:hypothetical protein